MFNRLMYYKSVIVVVFGNNPMMKISNVIDAVK